ncbi:hypothetical protein [Micromonospora sp. NPDC049799]|uniref:hypothetical protein n=1 Tax=Micromonospora sp. NPDC049799 TaxID=3154741 RepID=UPI0033E18594
MRLTVGPLAPAVYWRRRAVVLGAVLLFLIVLLNSCMGSGRNTGTSGDAQPTSNAATPGATPQATGTPLTPQTGAPSSGGSAGPADPAPSTGGPAGSEAPPAAPVAPVVDDGTCTDREITVTATALPASVVRGATVDLQLKIRNRSERTCSRDVGAAVQELFVKSGAETIWSSDKCGSGTSTGSDVQSFTPGLERSYQLGWNGRESTRCADGVAAGPNPPPGTYQVFARVGTRLSEPVKITITG